MPFVVSGGQMASTHRVASMSIPSSVELAQGVHHDYATIWRTQPQIRTVVGFLARNIAQLGLHLYRRVSDVDRERVTDHPIAVLLSRPGPGTTRYRLVDSLVNDMGIYDQAFLVKLSPEGGLPALQRVDPRIVTPLGTNPFEVDGWRVRGTRGYRDLSPNEVVHIRGHNPTDNRLGASPLETLRRILAEEFEAGRYREQLWRNSARTSGYLKRPAGAPKWSPEGKERFREQWQAQYTGDGPGAGGTPILEDGMEFAGVASTARDAQYIEARKLTREEVAAAYHIPLPMVGILDNATFSNIKEQHKQLYQDTLGPWLTMLVEDLQLQLLNDFEGTDGLYLEFNIAEKLRGSFEEQAAQLQTSVGGPWMTRNEARARVNLPQIDGGDELIVPLNVIAGGQASPTDSAPPPDGAQTASGRSPRGKTRLLLSKARPDGFEDRTQRLFAGFFERQGRSVISELGREKAAGRKASVTDVFDTERWSGELAADMFGLNLAIATTAGRTSMTELGEDPDGFDEPRTEQWHLATAGGIALAITLVTGTRLSEALDDDDPLAAVRGLFELFTAVRATQLAVSHVTSMSGFGSTEAARQLGRPATKTWRTRSLNPRRAHARLNGDTVGVDEVFANGARWPGDSGLDEDERANCVPVGTMVTAPGVQASWRRFYEGEMVHLALASGRMLAATPNHPILTQRGWVAAGQVDVSDQLVNSRVVQRLMTRQPHIHHEPAAIDQIHRSLSNVLVSRRMAGLAVDFHGDGRDGDVDVVWTTRRLLSHGVIDSLPQEVRNALFLATHPRGVGCCCGARPSGLLDLPGEATPAGGVSREGERLAVAEVGLGVPECCCLGERADRYGGVKEPLAYCAAVDAQGCRDGVLRHATFVANADIFHVEGQRLAAAVGPDLNSGADQSGPNSPASNPEFSADLLDRLAALIASDQVVDVERRHYAGHVFNLSTAGGWYSANGLIVHNCHCDLEMTVDAPEGGTP